MEVFPASDATPWAIIERVIRESDYYLLIIGGKYGSVDADGISYTEKEYDYAVSIGKPVLAFLHADPDNIPVGKSELYENARDRLVKFRQKVEQHHCKYWRTTEELKMHAIVGLTAEIAENPGVGWVRADGVDNQDLLKRLADLQLRFDNMAAENARLQQSLQNTDDAIRGLSTGQDIVDVELVVNQGENNAVDTTVSPTWDALFFGIAKDIFTPCSEARIRNLLTNVAKGEFSELTSTMNSSTYHLTDASFEKIKLQFLAFEFVELQAEERQITPNYRQRYTTWLITPRGRRHFLRSSAVRNDNSLDHDE